MHPQRELLLEQSHVCHIQLVRWSRPGWLLELRGFQSSRKRVGKKRHPALLALHLLG